DPETRRRDEHQALEHIGMVHAEAHPDTAAEGMADPDDRGANLLANESGGEVGILLGVPAIGWPRRRAEPRQIDEDGAVLGDQRFGGGNEVVMGTRPAMREHDLWPFAFADLDRMHEVPCRPAQISFVIPPIFASIRARFGAGVPAFPGFRACN